MDTAKKYNNGGMINKYKDKVICRGSVTLGTGCGTCEKCKDEIFRIKVENELKKTQEKKINNKKFYNFGWICPVCGRGNAPFTKTCSCIPIDNEIKITFIKN